MQSEEGRAPGTVWINKTQDKTIFFFFKLDLSVRGADFSYSVWQCGSGSGKESNYLTQVLMRSRTLLGFMNTVGHILPSDHVSTSVAVSFQCCRWDCCCVTLAQWKWRYVFPIPGRGCGIKCSSILWPHQLSSVLEEKKIGKSFVRTGVSFSEY